MCTHYTCEQCRQQKQQTQASSEAIQMHVPVQIKQHLRVYQGWATYKTMHENGKLNKTKQNKHILAQKTPPLSTSRWFITHLGYTAYYYPTAAGSLCWKRFRNKAAGPSLSKDSCAGDARGQQNVVIKVYLHVSLMNCKSSFQRLKV